MLKQLKSKIFRIELKKKAQEAKVIGRYKYGTEKGLSRRTAREWSGTT